MSDPSFPDRLAQLLWEEGKFPSGGARTSLATCKLIVNRAIARFVNEKGPKA